jgi:hypothetical protein
MKQIHKKYLTNMIFVWAGCFVLFLLLYLIVLAPQNKTRKQIITELVKIKKELTDAQQASQLQNQKILKKKIEDLRQNVGDFVINFEDSANLTFDISQIADKLRLTALSINSKGNQSVPSCKLISESQIFISFNAAFNQFITLLNELERHRPVVFVDKFAVTRSNNVYSENDVSMELSVFVTAREDASKDGG